MKNALFRFYLICVLPLANLIPNKMQGLAQYIANDIGLGHKPYHYQSKFSAKQMLEATKLNQKLQQRIKTQGMISWFEAEENRRKETILMEKHDDDMPKDKIRQAKRWRLILGQYADDALGQATFNADDLKIERTLDFLYRREYQRRGLRQKRGHMASLDASQLTAVNWLNQARKLFQ